jgi:hypothetical protein
VWVVVAAGHRIAVELGRPREFARLPPRRRGVVVPDRSTIPVRRQCAITAVSGIIGRTSPIRTRAGAAQYQRSGEHRARKGSAVGKVRWSW